MSIIFSGYYTGKEYIKEKIKLFTKLNRFLNKPQLYSPGTNLFWKEQHISQYVLDAHLDPGIDKASRSPEFIDKSVAWITSIAPPSKFRHLLDLGCGPGLYAQRFSNAGYEVTGIDFSKRSLEYAKKQTVAGGNKINYIHQDYLTIDYTCHFDVITLIYCDFGVLSAGDRAILANKIYKGLKPGGKFILDVFTPAEHSGRQEVRNWNYRSGGGFWNKQPYLSLDSFYRYDEDNTVLNQTIVINQNSIECYNLWEHCFTKDELSAEIQTAGFTQYELYGDVSGKKYDRQGNIICAVFTK